VEDPVKSEDPELLIQLVFVALVGGDFDHRGDLYRGVRAGGNVMPGMEAAGLNDRHGGIWSSSE
jgi:hypothetical protein